jgi:tRNA nucleotidyltransferase (CCA-adding enzyme)
VAELVSLHMFDLEDRAGRRAVVRVLLRLGREQFLRLCCLREADFIGSGRGAEPAGAEKWRRVLAEAEGEGAPISPRGLAVDGNDLMRELGIPPGKEVGRLLRRLHGLAVKKPAQNSYKNLIRYAKMMYTKQDGTERE